VRGHYVEEREREIGRERECERGEGWNRKLSPLPLLYTAGKEGQVLTRACLTRACASGRVATIQIATSLPGPCIGARGKSSLVGPLTVYVRRTAGLSQLEPGLGSRNLNQSSRQEVRDLAFQLG